MKRRLFAPIAICGLIASGSAIAAPSVSDKVTMEYSSSSDSIASYVATYEGTDADGMHVYSDTRGRKRRFDALGNWVDQGTVNHVPSNGQIPPADAVVGQKWSHSFDINSNGNVISRRRSCEVIGIGRYDIGPVSTDRAISYKCENQSVDRPLPMYQTIIMEPEITHFPVATDAEWTTKGPSGWSRLRISRVEKAQ